jgi:hypothetical protein
MVYLKDLKSIGNASQEGSPLAGRKGPSLLGTRKIGCIAKKAIKSENYSLFIYFNLNQI